MHLRECCARLLMLEKCPQREKLKTSVTKQTYEHEKLHVIIHVRKMTKRTEVGDKCNTTKI